MDKRFWLAVVVLFIVSMGLGFLVHGYLLADDYAKLPNLMRTHQDQGGYFGWMLLAHVLIATGFVWVYQQGLEPAKPWLGQGLRFGIAIAILTCIPTYLIYYAVEPIPSTLVVKQIVFDTIATLLMGVVVAWMYRTKTA
jgi:hypothetical protein